MANAEAVVAPIVIHNPKEPVSALGQHDDLRRSANFMMGVAACVHHAGACITGHAHRLGCCVPSLDCCHRLGDACNALAVPWGTMQTMGRVIHAGKGVGGTVRFRGLHN